MLLYPAYRHILDITLQTGPVPTTLEASPGMVKAVPTIESKVVFAGTGQPLVLSAQCSVLSCYSGFSYQHDWEHKVARRPLPAYGGVAVHKGV